MHLTWDEDIAYTRLLRVYYRDEKPIPIEPRQAYRLTRAQSKGQRQAVDEVLKEFFEKQVDGWHNKRADEEIAAAKAQQETNRRIAANRPRSVNGSNHESSNGSSTKGPPIQTPDSNSQTPDSNSQSNPPLAPPSKEGSVNLKNGHERRSRSGWTPPPSPDEREAQREAERLEREEAAHANR